MRAMVLLALRHGETEWNVQRRFQGQLDSTLTSTGLQQAAALAQRVAQLPRLNRLYASDLGRALATAAPIALATQQPIYPLAAFRERHFGIFGGYSREQWDTIDPEGAARLLDHDPDFAPSGGESQRQCYQRVVAAIHTLASTHAGERVGLVTHGGVLAMLYRAATGLPVESPRTFELYNASINTFSVTPDQITVEQWGDVSHLANTDRFDEI